MSHINTLKVYKNALQAGYTEEQAQHEAYSLDETMNGVASNESLESLEKRIGIHFIYIHIIEVVIFLGIIGILVQGFYRG